MGRSVSPSVPHNHLWMQGSSSHSKTRSRETDIHSTSHGLLGYYFHCKRQRGHYLEHRMADRPLLKAQDGRGATTKSKGWQRGYYLEHRMAEGLLLRAQDGREATT